MRPAENPQAVVERVLSTSALAGRTALADLLYELAKACLIADPQAELRTYRGTEPRPVEAVSHELKRVQSRLPADRTTEPTPSSTPLAPAAVEAAKKCIDLLENVEGATPRQRLITAQVHIIEMRYAEAEDLCRRMLDEALPTEYRKYVFMNMCRTLVRQRRFEEAVVLGERAVSEAPNVFMTTYNLAVSLAWLGNRPRFDEVARQAARLVGANETSFERSMIMADAPTLAERLTCSSNDVLDAFGIAANA
jgi:tetratricopeptide (TPR) repeat protein